MHGCTDSVPISTLWETFECEADQVSGNKLEGFQAQQSWGLSLGHHWTLSSFSSLAYNQDNGTCLS